MTDSLPLPPLSETIADHTHHLKLKEVLIPVAAFGASASFVGHGWGFKQRENIQDALSASGRRKFKWDDYMQYSPMVAAYVLDLAHLKGQHGFKDKTIILAMSYATMGILVNAMKFSVKLLSGNVFTGEEDLSVWISDDDNRIPVLFEAPILVGVASGRIESCSGLKYPFSSLVKKGKARLSSNAADGRM